MLPRNWQKLTMVDSRVLEYTNEYSLFHYLNIDFTSDPKINLNYSTRTDDDKQKMDFFLNYLDELVLPIEMDIKTRSLILRANTSEQMMLFLEVVNQYQPFENTKDSASVSMDDIQAFINQGFHFFTASMLENIEGTQSNKNGGSYQHIYNTLNNNLPSTPYNSPIHDVIPSRIDQAIEKLTNVDLPLAPVVPMPRALTEADIQRNLVHARENLENELTDLFEDLDVSDSESIEYDESEELERLLTDEEYQRYLDEKQNQDESRQRPRYR